MLVSKRIQIDPYLLLCINMKSIRIKEFKIKPGIMIEVKLENNIECIGTGDNILSRTPVV